VRACIRLFRLLFYFFFFFVFTIALCMYDDDGDTYPHFHTYTLTHKYFSDFDGDVPSDPSLISDPNADAATAAALACRFPGARLLHADPVVRECIWPHVQHEGIALNVYVCVRRKRKKKRVCIAVYVRK
jgi:hypothetical protein